MSFFASVLRAAYKLSGAKKAFTLPEDEILTVIEKQNRSRGVFTPKDHKAHYEMITVNGFPCLIVRERPQPSKRAIYSADEVLYGALPDFEEACRRANVPYTAFARPGMVHCYCMLPYFKEAREDFAKIAEIFRS